MKKIIDNEKVDCTAEDIAQFETDKQNAIAEQQTYETAKQAEATDKANGNQKLLDLGLNTS
jgi:hypothetical protein